MLHFWNFLNVLIRMLIVNNHAIIIEKILYKFIYIYICLFNNHKLSNVLKESTKQKNLIDCMIIILII